jgi:HEPN domain-containing protein
MGHDPSNWIRAADRDVLAAKALIREGLHAEAVFHAHQVAEESLKALWLATAERLPPRTHSLVELAEGLSAPEGVLEACRRLNPHYGASRYPDAANGDPADNYTGRIASELLAEAEEVRAWCSGQQPN